MPRTLQECCCHSSTTLLYFFCSEILRCQLPSVPCMRPDEVEVSLCTCELGRCGRPYLAMQPWSLQGVCLCTGAPAAWSGLTGRGRE